METENSRLRKLATLFAGSIAVTQLTACESSYENQQRIRNVILIGAAVAGGVAAGKAQRSQKRVTPRNGNSGGSGRGCNGKPCGQQNCSIT